MSASIVTFAQLGARRNLKSADIEPVIEALHEHRALERVVCFSRRGYHLRNSVAAIPLVVRYALRVYTKVFGPVLSRKNIESLFDYFAQYKVGWPDLVFFHSGYFLPKTLKAARSRGSISVDISATAHIRKNAELERMELISSGCSDYKGVYMELAASTDHLNVFDYVIALSEFVRNSYIEQGYPEKNIYIAEPDIDRERFQPRTQANDEDVFRIVYIAYTTPLKGLWYLLQAWSKLQLQNAELVLVGGYGNMPPQLRAQYDALVAADQSIRWVGHSDRPEEYYEESSALVFPSLTEGFGRVTLEAMASGLPVITTENAKGIVEDGKTGFVVPIRDADALAEKIRYLYEHRDVAAQMGREARKAVENKKPFGEAVYEIYKEILRREGKL